MNEVDGRLVVRAPNHLGDLVMALPALGVARAETIVVTRQLVSLLRLTALPARILPLDRGLAGFGAAARSIRQGRYDRAILLTPSFSSAMLFRMGHAGRIRGSATDRRTFLLDEAVDRSGIDARHRAVAYWFLVTGHHAPEPPVPRLAVPRAEQTRWRELAGDPGDGRTVGLFPGGNASSRRWPADRFRQLAELLGHDGHRVIVFGGPGERDLTAAIAQDTMLDAGGRTDLPMLAAGLNACDILITNDSGPMHLAAAVGTPTLSLFGAGNPDSTGALGAGNRVLRRAELACVPCVRNTCPRSGAGFILPTAERECLNLITVQQVLAEARSMLEAS